MRYRGLAVCDLRWVKTVEDAGSIDSIEDAVAVVYPKDAAPEVESALRQIPMQNVAAFLTMGEGGKIQTINGKTGVFDSDASEDGALLIVNGKAILYPLSPQKKLSLIVNGKVIVHESLKQHDGITFLCVNGKREYLDFSVEKHFEDLKVTADFLRWLPPKTLLSADDVEISLDVPGELLQEKVARLTADEIRTPRRLLGLVRVLSVADDIDVLD